jgi:muramoyltetrapeptide carboxypeptidase
MPAATQPARIKPPALRPGDTVAVVAPASHFQRELFLAGCQELERLGYKPFYLPSIFERDLYFAGSAERRARELEEMFERDEVRAVFCARGGYGANYLLPLIDPAKIRRHPKIFLGYSDVTSLLTWLCDAAGLVVFHGPMVARDLATPNGCAPNVWSMLQAEPGPGAERARSWTGASALVRGDAQGMLYGGCLSMLVASLGTPYEIRTAGTILYLEDVNARPYQVDRMLMQLKLAGKFKEVRGLLFGPMTNCVPEPGQNYTLEEVILRVVGELGIPVGFGFPSGHVETGNTIIPLGVPATLTVGAGAEGAVHLVFESPVASAVTRVEAAR